RSARASWWRGCAPSSAACARPRRRRRCASPTSPWTSRPIACAGATPPSISAPPSSACCASSSSGRAACSRASSCSTPYGAATPSSSCAPSTCISGGCARRSTTATGPTSSARCAPRATRSIPRRPSHLAPTAAAAQAAPVTGWRTRLMATPERATAPVKIRIGEVAAVAYRLVFGRLGLVLDLGWLPLLVMLAAELAPGVLELLRPMPADAAAPAVRVADIVGVVAALLCLSAFAVRWYQALLMVASSGPPRRLFFVAWARFILYTVIFSLPAAGSAIGLTLTGASPTAADETSRLLAAGMALPSLVLALAVLRLSLLWPAAAQGFPMSWRAAWRAMRGNTWRLVAVMLVVYLPIFLTGGFALGIIFAAAHVDIDQASA